MYMKVNCLFLLMALTCLLAGCKDAEPGLPSVNLSLSGFENVSNEGATLELDVTATSSWRASSDEGWCRPLPEKGRGSQQLAIQVDGNLEAVQRTATVTITAEGMEKKIQIHQNATMGELRYRLPVIFHVLYKDRSDKLQYVSQQRLDEILAAVNGLYAGSAGSVDMNLSFVLASTGPDGNALSTPGVEYIQYDGRYPIDCEAFMRDNTGRYAQYLWDPNQYINVMVYNFKADGESASTTLGISHLPFSTVGSNYLEGLSETRYGYLDLENLKFPYSVSLNSLYVGHQSTPAIYDPTDVTVTLAHELGHYLGLYHAFSEDDDGLVDGCVDSDFCEDTPSYNRVEYEARYDYLQQYEPEKLTFRNLVERTDCDGTTFVSYNVMDYSVSYSDRFTDDQRGRIRHVLTYSPLIPGPKKDVTKTRSATAAPLDLPIRVVK